MQKHFERGIHDIWDEFVFLFLLDNQDITYPASIMKLVFTEKKNYLLICQIINTSHFITGLVCQLKLLNWKS